jgi:hypothetical protein
MISLLFILNSLPDGVLLVHGSIGLLALLNVLLLDQYCRVPCLLSRSSLLNSGLGEINLGLRFLLLRLLVSASLSLHDLTWALATPLFDKFYS